MEDLKNRICKACGQITQHMLQKTKRNVIDRCRKCMGNNGGHFEQTLQGLGIAHELKF